ncbi:MAG: site-specific integrase [Spirochaetes bacterium]|nr:site-specific integrase [Spirochaetota bacterium]MBU1079624.1 site-specific integrase [Spirochaetota bacterium]
MAEDYYVFKRSGRDNLYVQFRNPRSGKLGAAVSSGKTSEAAAIRWAKNELKIRSEQEAGKPRKSWTLGDWAKPFFTDTCPYLQRKRDEGKTYSKQYVDSSADYIKRFVLPDEIAHIPLEELTRRDILAWRRRLIEKEGPRRFLVHVLGALKVVLSEAVYQELLDYSPASKVANPTYPKKTREAISLESLAKMLAPSAYAEPRHWLATVTAAFTGMRAAEIRALEWDALDFKRRLVYVTQAFKDQSARLGPPKSGKPRVAPMPEGLAKLLLEWKGRADRGHGVENGQWVFGYSKNRPLGYKEWSYAVKKAATAAGCEGATLHYLRHTLNTYLLGAGVDSTVLRASMGWSGEAIQGNYTHADKFDYSSQAAAIDRIIKIGGPDGQEDKSDSE